MIIKVLYNLVKLLEVLYLQDYYELKNLKEKGYNVTVFCANTFLNNTNIIDTNNKKYKI